MKRKEIVSALVAILVFCLGACVQVLAQRAKVLMIDKGSYQVYYNPALGLPEVVLWRLTAGDIGSVKRDPSFRFKTDKDTPRPRVTSAMYTHSGYQRGHMCPAADRSASKDLMKSTFVMSNVAPMTPSLNTGAWKITENYGRQLLCQADTIQISASTIFFPKDTSWIGGGRVAVPHAFMKVITIPGEYDFCKIFILENL